MNLISDLTSTDLNSMDLNSRSASTETAELIAVRGRVQGVGFRPAVYRLAQALRLRGDVCNSGQGVQIRLAGAPDKINHFVQQLLATPPPLARIDTLERQPISLETIATSNFQIATSLSSPVRTEISPDAATCPACRAEVFDPYSRRYRYPFTNCTHCGPRLSIVRGIPYDRALTSMARFQLCPACQQEYADVTDRRFHAQPMACHVCGPKAWLEPSQLSLLDDLDAVSSLLQQGEIVAIKGIGGFHLACDATHATAVAKLRRRKHRPDKPLALMARDMAMIEAYCLVNEQERQLLESPAAPIVLLTQLATPVAPEIVAGVAPDQDRLGFMLPYTPLHHLILKRMNQPIVLTSGNISDQPQCIDNDAARRQLVGIADYVLFHDREIVNRVDDSVVRVVAQHPQVLRRTRGYAPAPMRLPAGFEQAPPLLAMGSQLKNTFCLLHAGQGILSQHLGDLENATVLEAYQQTLQLYLQLFEHQPTAVAIDRHPEYLASKLGREFAQTHHLPICEVQHHHAHIVAGMAEHGLPLQTAPVLGIALDGLGYGEDGQLWGGEFLLADYTQFQRLAHLKPTAMLGGEQAIYQPWRNTYAQLMAGGDPDTPEATWQTLTGQYQGELWDYLAAQPLPVLNQMLRKGINAPLASSCGRLFDAVAAALGLHRERCTYEGQAAMALETVANQYLRTPQAWLEAQQNAYPLTTIFSSGRLILDPGSIWPVLLTDLQQGVATGAMAARFHLGLATAITRMTIYLRQSHAFSQVVLSGGVWQNTLLWQQVHQRLTAQGLTVLSHEQVPANDGGLALGQAVVASARILAGSLGSSRSRLEG
jgi:hydrogenase maturation protein HypF